MTDSESTISPFTNPYEPAASVEKQEHVNEGQGKTIERYPMSWKIATLVGLIVGYLTWYTFSQLTVMSRSVSWLVQGSCLAIGQLSASIHCALVHRPVSRFSTSVLVPILRRLRWASPPKQIDGQE